MAAVKDTGLQVEEIDCLSNELMCFMHEKHHAFWLHVDSEKLDIIEKHLIDMVNLMKDEPE